MLSNLRDIWHILVNYEGTGYVLIVYLAAFLYLFIAEKDKKNRMLLLYIPGLIMLLIICPIFYRLYMGYLDDSGTYYRMMWLLPISFTIAAAACRAISAHRRIGTVLIAIVIGLTGSFVYTSVDSKKAENLYHIPGYVIEMCDLMEQDIPGVNVYACVPLEMLFYTRQYDSSINLLYGREAAEPTWGYSNEYFDEYELSESLDWNRVCEMTRDTSLGTGVVTYFVVAKDRKMNQSPEECGLTLIHEAGNYLLYKDEVAVNEVKEMLKGTPYWP